MPEDTHAAGSPGLNRHLDAANRLAATHFFKLAALLAVACGALLAFLIRVGWFADDDFSNLTTADSMGLTPAFLVKPVLWTRLSPGHRLVDWIVIQWPGNEWAIAVAISALCLAGATFFGAVLVRQVSASPVLALAVAALFGTWVGWVRIGLWWPTGAHTFPAVMLILASLCLAMSWSGKRSPGLLAGTILAALAALAFSSRAVLIPALIAVLLFLGKPSTRSLHARELGRQLRAGWPPVAGTLVVAAAFAYLESQTYGFRKGPSLPDLGTWLAFAKLWMIEAQAALALNRIPSNAQSIFLTTLPGLAVGAALAACTIRGSRSALIWAATVALVLGCGIQVGWVRLGQYGTDIAFEPRYHEGELVVLLALVPSAWAAAGKPLASRSPRYWVTAAAVLWGFIWVASLAIGAQRIRSEPPPSRSNPGAIPKATMETIRRTLPNALAGSTSPTIVDTTLPAGLSVIGGAQTADVLALFFPETKFTRWQPDGTPISIDDQGIATAIRVTDNQRVLEARRTCLVTAPASKWLGKGSAEAVFQLPRARTTAKRLLSMRLTGTRSRGSVALTFLPAAKEGLPDLVLRVRPGGRDGIRVLVPFTASGFRIGAWGGLDTCVSNPRVGTVASN